MKLNFFAIVAIIFATACSSKNTYNADKCDQYLDKYCYETAFNHDSDAYDASLRSMSQTEFSNIIGQLTGILENAKEEMTAISKCDNIAIMRQQYKDFNNKTMILHFVMLNGLIGDADYRNLLDEDNKKAYKNLSTIANEIDIVERKIKQRI